MKKEFENLTNDEIDCAVATEIMGLEVEMRYCNCNNECGEWEEAEDYINYLKEDKNESRSYELEMESIEYGSTIKKLCWKETGHNDFLNEDWTNWNVLKSYCEDYNQAFEVVGKMTNAGYIFELFDDLNAYTAIFTECETGRKFTNETMWSDGKRPICEAALCVIRNKGK